jgi:hypothetical protein
MNAAAAHKSPAMNKLEGMALTAIFQGFPNFAGAALLLKLCGSDAIVGNPGGAAIFVTLAALLHAMLTPYLARKYPKIVKRAYEPRFFDPALSVSEKLAQWRAQPATSLQLVTMVMMQSLLAVALLSVG